MDDYGQLLYAGETDNDKTGYAFVILGIAFLIGANFIYARTFALVIGGLFAFYGLYLLFFKRSEPFAIYEQAVVLTSKGQERAIPKEQISQIEYIEVRGRRALVSNFYPVLKLHDEKSVLINKAFNSAVNRDFKHVLDSYLS